MRAKPVAVPETVDFDHLDRSFLKDPRSLNAYGAFVAAGDLMQYVADMCVDARMQRITAASFTMHRVMRDVAGKRKRAYVESGTLFGMYQSLRRGELPDLFVDVLRRAGYAASAMQLDLTLNDRHIGTESHVFEFRTGATRKQFRARTMVGAMFGFARRNGIRTTDLSELRQELGRRGVVITTKS